MSIRANVVSLLATIASVEGSPTTWTKTDGTFVTVAERDLLESATAEECEAAVHYGELVVATETDRLAIVKAVQAIVLPYLVAAPAGSTIRDIYHLMTTQEQDECRRLTALVSPN